MDIQSWLDSTAPVRRGEELDAEGRAGRAIEYPANLQIPPAGRDFTQGGEVLQVVGSIVRVVVIVPSYPHSRPQIDS